MRLHLRALLRALEHAEADAQREIVALAGATLANDLGDDRDCDLLRRLTANGDAERRVNVGEALGRYAALAEALERGLNAAARSRSSQRIRTAASAQRAQLPRQTNDRA